MQQSKNDFWVGLFVMLGAAALVFLALQSANLLQLNFQTGYRVTARFDNIGGLKPKAAVKSSGVVVGRVTAIEFDNKTYQAVAVIDMDSKYHFPNDSMLKIMTSGLLGDQYVGVEAGYEEAVWKQNDEVTNTQSAVVLENLIGQFMTSKSLEAGTNSDGTVEESPAPAAHKAQHGASQ